MLGAGEEVEVSLPGRYKVSPQIAGAIKAVPGVVEVRACRDQSAWAVTKRRSADRGGLPKPLPPLDATGAPRESLKESSIGPP